MRSKKDRKERVRQLAAGWLTKSLEVIKGDLPKDDLEALTTAFYDYCKEHGIDKPQDKSLRELILVNTTAQVKALKGN